MDPITIIGGLAIYAWLKGQKKTPQAAAQTVSNVDQIAAALVSGQVGKAAELKSILLSQAKALGLTFGAAGHPPDQAGITVSEYIYAPPAYSPFTAVQVQALSSVWGSFAHSVAAASKDSNISQDEALDIAGKAQALATALYEMSLQLAQYQKKT